MQIGKFPDRQVYAPSLEFTAPIRLADRNDAHYPSHHSIILKKRWLDDGLPAHANRSKRDPSEDVTRTLDVPPCKVRSDISPHPKGQPVRRLRAAPFKELKQDWKIRLDDGLPAHAIQSTRESSEDVATYT